MTFISIYDVYTVFFGREITVHTVIYSVHIRFWPTLDIHYLAHRQRRACCMFRVGQNRISAPYMTVCMVISLPKVPYQHRINTVYTYKCMVLTNPMYVKCGDELGTVCKCSSSWQQLWAIGASAYHGSGPSIVYCTHNISHIRNSYCSMHTAHPQTYTSTYIHTHIQLKHTVYFCTHTAHPHTAVSQRGDTEAQNGTVFACS
jgi:hypothetical protein